MAKPKGSINFISYDKPSITDGVYDLSVSQGFAVGNGSVNPKDTEMTLKIAALGPRFSLEPQLITGKFPPDKSMGQYFTVLPHIVFKRSILPWERKISAQDTSYEDSPWLALLLFTKEDKFSLQTVTLGTLLNPQKEWQFPSITLEPGQNENDRVLVLDVPGSTLQNVLPTREALPYLAHVRKSADQAGAPEYAILVCGRLPKPGSECVVHLVSLEDRTDLLDSFDVNKTYRLVSLTSWNFGVITSDVGFTDLLETAHDNDTDKSSNEASKNVLRMPTLDPNAVQPKPGTNAKINGLYRQGLVPLPHQTRQGNQLVSWFRGPLLPGSTKQVVDFTKLNVTAADQLVQYDSNLGMFDVSYAAAWELGRLLMLRRRRISVAFYNWKRVQSQAAKQISMLHLPFARQSRSLGLPDAVNDWFAGLGMLNDVPYNSLVPDARELPQPSIRFFSVDSSWMAYLLDGAFSVGRVVDNKPAGDAALRSAVAIPGQMSGFLLRSPVVAGWPHMEGTGYNIAGDGTSVFPDGASEANILPLLRLERIAADTLFCLFSGGIKTLALGGKGHVTPL